MSDYNFLSDLLHTFQSLNDGIKLVVLLVPPCFLLCAFGLLLRHRAMIKAIETGRLELDALPVREIYDRVDYLRSRPMAIDQNEVIYAEPLDPTPRRN